MHEQRACGEGECESRFGEGVEDLQIHVRRRFQDVALLLDVVVERDDQRRVGVVREVGRDVRRISGNVLDLRGDGPQYLQRLFHLFGSRVVGQPQLHHGPPHRLRGDVDDGGVRDLVVRIARDAPVVTQYPRAAHAHVDHGSLQPVHVDRVADAERLVRKDGECAEDVLHRVLRGQREGDAADVKAIVSYEPGGGIPFPEGQVPEEGKILTLSKKTEGVEVPMSDFVKYTGIPIIVYYGDNLPETDERPELYEWTRRLHLMRKWAKMLNDLGGDVTIVHLPEAGLHGNTHFPFSDLNNIEVANLLSKWLYEKNLD